LQDTPVTFNQLEGILKNLNASDLLAEITKEGAGQDLYA